MPVVITNCTNRKRGSIGAKLSAASLDEGSVSRVAAQWIRGLRTAPVNHIAQDVYCGRSFREAEASALTLDGPLYIVSAGLGIVESTALIPNYDLTISAGTTNSIANKIVGVANPQSWWKKISQDSPYGTSFLDILRKHQNDLVLVALPRPYLELILDELRQLTPQQATRVRFFGKSLDRYLPESLTSNWMPYDDRLDYVGKKYRGTQTDLAQRALRHFVEKVFLSNKKNASTATHRSLVTESLVGRKKRKTPVRTRLDDESIGAAVRANWAHGNGKSSALLRILRRELSIACEQSRFRAIYHSVRRTMETDQ